MRLAIPRRTSPLLAIAGLALLSGTPYSPALRTMAATPPTDVSTGYQVDDLHDGGQSDNLQPPLLKRWSVDLGGTGVSFPLIAGGRAFVTVGSLPLPPGGTTLYSLDLATGATMWSFPLGAYSQWSGIAYEAGSVFAVNGNGSLTSFDANTGSIHWNVQLPGQYSFTSAPTAYNGTVYLGGAGSGGTVYAVRESDGKVLWTHSVMNGDESSPVVTSTGVYVSYACAQTYDLDPLTGNEIWHHSTYCEGGGGKTPALNGSNLYVRDAITGNAVLDAATGTQTGTFVATPIPAFANGQGFFMNGGVLSAYNVPIAAPASWTFTGDGALDSAPLVVNGRVYEGSSNGNLYAIDPAHGTATWSDNVGWPIPAPDEQNQSQPLTGFGAGLGFLLIPAGTHLIAYSNGPLASVQPSSVDFGGVAAGTTATQTVTLTNAGAVPLNVATAAVSGTDFSLSADGCSNQSVPAYADCKVTVAFSPSATGLQRTGTLTFTDNAPDSPQSVQLTGIGAQPQVGLSPGPLHFGGEQVGSTTTALYENVIDTGQAPLHVSSVVATGTNASDFHVDATACTSAAVAPGQSCSVSVTFTPGASGARSATVSLTDDAPGSPQSFSVDGTGVVAGASVSPTTISFGLVAVGTTSAAQTVTVTSTGAWPLTISSVSIGGTNPGDFGFAGDGCTGAGLNNGSSCTIQLTFAPTTSGSRTATMAIADNSPDSPQLVTLSGTGGTPAVAYSPAPLDFGSVLVGKSASLPVKVVNTGNVPLHPTSWTLLTAGQYALATDGCSGTVVAPGAYCTDTISFSPGDYGTFTGQFNVISDAPGNPQTVSLTGVGVTGAPAFSAPTLDFGSVKINHTSSLTETVTNIGNATLTITSIAIYGTNATDFSKGTDTCAHASLAPGQSCYVVVKFRPEATGLEQAGLGFTDNHFNRTYLDQVVLQGQGVK